MRSDGFALRCFDMVWKRSQREVFISFNQIISVISLLIVSGLKLWCKCSLALYVTRLTGSILQLIAFNIVVACLKPITDWSNLYWINYILLKTSIFRTCVNWIESNASLIVLKPFKNQFTYSSKPGNSRDTYSNSKCPFYNLKW